MALLLEQAERSPSPDWTWPMLACQAVGADAAVALPGASALAGMQISILLVDDILDDDPRGEHLRIGVGPTANMALALQAAAFRVIEHAGVDADRRAAVTASLAWMALATALGQDWDAKSLTGEENYWKVIRAKSTPFYGAALHVGALLGGADHPVANQLRDLGLLLGEVIQLLDDLVDAFQIPAGPDWKQHRNNLLVLYARTAEHPFRDRFMELLPQVDDPAALREAQQILTRCGAVSYCAYHLVKRDEQARAWLRTMPLADPAPMHTLLEEQRRPLVRLLQASGAELPAELLVE
jgi:geranylgeranyl pyrophosphate synthase